MAFHGLVGCRSTSQINVLKASRNSEVLRTAVALLDYWRAHPQAKDSAKGIAQYWVGEEVDTVYQALTLLVEEGAIAKRRHLYQLASLHNGLGDSTMKNLENILRQLRARESGAR